MSKSKISFLLAAIALSCESPSTWGSFNYDLRFAPGQGQTDDHNLTLGAAGGTYTLQLWGQIVSDADLTNDSWWYGVLGVGSAQSAGGAFSSGGITSGAVNVALFPHSENGLQSSLTPDGIFDWGSTNTATTTGWMLWQQIPPGVPDGTPGPGSQQIPGNPNGWEILLADFTVFAGGVSGNGGTTSFNVVSGLSGRLRSGVVTLPTLLVREDNPAPAQTNIGTQSGLSFHSAPEPASLCLLSLGALFALTRRSHR